LPLPDIAECRVPTGSGGRAVCCRPRPCRGTGSAPAPAVRAPGM